MPYQKLDIFLPQLLKAGHSGALAGLAPADPGAANGTSPMAALVASKCNPVLRPLYQRLRAKGKTPKVALAALMRKLAELANTLLKQPAFAPIAKA